ncbi:hypothetical protein FEP52_06004 [Burkholderia multivorans]|jgi:hypothetical protein|nr:hypothetical protein [Burkholderia multivorans]MDR9042572.1 hypothetical protein [Burkholderia multivorans]MDR9090224.1 hypothetical protein [Burkholderia multivorans]MDR9114008.1 hypothetical protein [Burkholderia multivorans]
MDDGDQAMGRCEGGKLRRCRNQKEDRNEGTQKPPPQESARDAARAASDLSTDSTNP